MDEDFSSLAEHVMNRELYVDSSPTYDEGCSPETEVPFSLLHGENPTNFTVCKNGKHLVVLTNYRLFASMEEGYYSVPLGLIESTELRQPNDLLVLCKDCRSFKLSFEAEAQSRSWSERILTATRPKTNFRDTFAFIHYAYKRDLMSGKRPHPLIDFGTTCSFGASLLTSEYQRMEMGLSEMWRITESNSKYKICGSYPKLFVVPRSVTDNDLQEVANFRSLGRVPAVVWRHRGNGCILARCSQPLVGVLGWRCQEDEKFLQALAQSCTPRAPGPVGYMQRGEPVTNGHAQTPPSLLILDLRSYAATLGNRAKGGGCEHPDYYSNCEIRYKGLANIHSIRKSYLNLRLLLLTGGNQPSFLSSLEATQWIQNLYQLMSAAEEVASTIHLASRPVVVHCSDGWDRTTQVVALAEILLDPFYRTFEGFKIIIEREWLAFGHKFSDRCGFGAEGEQSPIFTQWLDCVHQLMKQFPTAFQFNISYLVRLAHHSSSLLYGTFLLNCEQQREEEQLAKHTLSVWSLLNQENRQWTNTLYKKQDSSVLIPNCHPKDLLLWHELYSSTHLMIPYSPTTSHVPHNSSRQATPSNTPPINGTVWHNTESDITDVQDMECSQTREDMATSSKKCRATIKSNIGTIISIHEIKTHTHSKSGIVSSSTQDKSISNGDVNREPITNENANGTYLDERRGKEDDRQGNKEELASVMESEVFHSFNFESKLVGSEERGLELDNREPLGFFPSCMKSVEDMEDSFRVVEDTSEQPSLTTKIVPPMTSVVSEVDQSLTGPTSHDNLNFWSVEMPKQQSLDMSTFSECESRLRNLSEDGVGLYLDPVQQRVMEIEDGYKEKVGQLEEKIRRLTMMLRHKMDSTGSKEEGERKELLELIDESSDSNTEQPTSPGNGWTHVDIEDTVGVQWTPDHAVSHCQLCGAEFWLGRRKHHCRNCGGVFCWKCSNYHSPVPKEQLYGNQRVCRKCFDKLDGFLKPDPGYS